MKHKYRLQIWKNKEWITEWCYRFLYQALRALKQSKKDQPKEMFRVVKEYEWW